MEYQKNLEMYKLMRSRFEEYYIKCMCFLHQNIHILLSTNYIHKVKAYY